ncbi:TonB-dependent receptor [Asticcacaulis sp. EMRT-3]|uniref:TonB-dependent receptor n=1 Tax=Asticcacaulis sp. EMRT-3 TaxID=3040349 RepID=UPI0024AFF214|nr:TonB-dependent receptor [Asticcacaulis sp. EMRT-3]MDI7775745.1 TonB-dependent receptor [Asticcacaulis sp. EMRT-3]
MRIKRNNCGVSRTALTVALLCGVLGGAGHALAQTAGTDTTADKAATTDDTTVVVVGSRKALQSAQDIKKKADTIVDSITATDIGAFPDKSVAEALQRVPGVTVIRSVAGGDVMHFPAEPTGVIIRGLQQVKSEFNGRDIFSAGDASGLSWEDVSPEMLSGVDTYKNLTADMLEGGIAGTVNLRTRLPFDQKGQLISGTIEGDYGDLSKTWTPSGSVLYSNRWSTDLGDFGFLADIAYSKIETTSQGAILPRMMPFAAGTYTDQMNYIPSGISYNNTVYDRTRRGLSLAGQWASTDNHFKATLQYNKSSYQNSWNEDQLLSYWAYVDPSITTQSTVWTDPSIIAPPDAPGLGINQAGGGTPFTFGSNGMFQKGVITSSAGDWGYGGIDWSANPVTYLPGSTDQYGTYDQYGINEPIYQPCLDSDSTHANVPCRIAPAVNLATRYSTEKRNVEDTALNFIWMPTDKLKLTFDAQHVLSTNTHYDITYRNGTYANLNVDLTGDLPKLNFEAPSGYNVVGTDPLADYRNYFNESIMDHLEDSKATMNAFQIDGAYAFDGPWLNELRAGVRTSERDQLNQWSAYDWQPISSNWGANPADSFHLDAPATASFAGYPGTYWQTTNFGDSGLLKGLIGQDQFVTINPSYLKDINLMESTFGMTAQSAGGKTPSSTWDPICMRAANIAGSCFQPGEILNVTQKEDSAYVMLKFGGPDATLFGSSITLSGNIGMRLVKTDLTSVGATNFATPFTADDLNCKPLSPEEIASLQTGQYAISPQCLAVNSTDDQAFSNGGYASSTVKTSHTYNLPSLNLAFAFPGDWIVRFAASRGMSMPDMGLLKNYITLQRSYVPQSAITQGNPSIVLNGSGQPVSYIYGYSGSTGNPRLKAIQADQFDLSLEHYFAAVGSFSFDIFTKTFYDYIQNSTFVVPLTNNGVTRNAVITGPVNGEGASVKGFEVAYQRYFTALPKPFDGLGIQANYTHLHNEGVKNSNLYLDDAGGNTVARSAQDGMINAGRLEQLSDDSYNLILMYDKGPIGARLAYNWRSKYVNSVNDCCIGFPVWNRAEGFLDGSLRYAITPHMEMDIQGSNLLKTRPKIYQEVEGPTNASPNATPVFLPAGTFDFDRRLSVSIRFKY